MQRRQGTPLKLPFSGPLFAGLGEQQHLHVDTQSCGTFDATQHRFSDQTIPPKGINRKPCNHLGENLKNQLEIALLM